MGKRLWDFDTGETGTMVKIPESISMGGKKRKVVLTLKSELHNWGSRKTMKRNFCFLVLPLESFLIIAYDLWQQMFSHLNHGVLWWVLPTLTETSHRVICFLVLMHMLYIRVRFSVLIYISLNRRRHYSSEADVH